MKLDNKNCQILNLLQTDCRMSLSEIGRQVGLSVDSVKKRINKMIDNDVFFPKIQLRPRNFGFKNIVEVKIKLNNFNKEGYKGFIEYLKKTPDIVEILAISGNWDISIVIIAKDAIDLGKITKQIRHKYGKMISNWTESITTCSYRFERYDMVKIMKQQEK